METIVQFHIIILIIVIVSNLFEVVDDFNWLQRFVTNIINDLFVIFLSRLFLT
jgi:hypothetical protein